jgi:hypothetical protein
LFFIRPDGPAIGPPSELHPEDFCRVFGTKSVFQKEVAMGEKCGCGCGTKKTTKKDKKKK